MKIILQTYQRRAPKVFVVGVGFVFILLLALLTLPGLVGYGFGMRHHWVDGSWLPKNFTSQWSNKVEDQSELVEHALLASKERFNALTVKMAELQAKVVRLDALGERLVDSSGLKQQEFDFSQSPAVGGPHEEEYSEAFQQPSFIAEIEKLSIEIEAREQQLKTLQALLINRKVSEDVLIAGRPIKKGWMSSRFGKRTDPFTGRLAVHKGVDFAGKMGSQIIAVAAGIVTKAGNFPGYGNLIEINHGQGYVTRYAHCREILVKVGDVVRTSDLLALMGSSGRSTGPHVHFEVLRNGKHVDPARYINRKKG